MYWPGRGGACSFNLEFLWDRCILDIERFFFFSGVYQPTVVGRGGEGGAGRGNLWQKHQLWWCMLYWLWLMTHCYFMILFIFPLWYNLIFLVHKILLSQDFVAALWGLPFKELLCLHYRVGLLSTGHLLPASKSSWQLRMYLLRIP